MTFLLMFSYFDNNCHKSHKKLNICKFTKITLNPLNFLTPLCVSGCACMWIVFVTIETMSNKNGKNFLVTHNRDCKK